MSARPFRSGRPFYVATAAALDDLAARNRRRKPRGRGAWNGPDWGDGGASGWGNGWESAGGGSGSAGSDTPPGGGGSTSRTVNPGDAGAPAYVTQRRGGGSSNGPTIAARGSFVSTASPSTATAAGAVSIARR